jgi:di- and tripeptidase
MQLSLDHKADWWLGDLDDSWFKSLENAIESVWGVAPLRIREGGVCCLLPLRFSATVS